MTELRPLIQAQDVSEHVLVLVANCVDDWFPSTVPLDPEEFIDRLCNDSLNAAGWDIENLDTPAVRKILRHARRIRREMQ